MVDEDGLAEFGLTPSTGDLLPGDRRLSEIVA
jgi:hypothetical protein